jgi:hypothetical protein
MRRGAAAAVALLAVAAIAIAVAAALDGGSERGRSYVGRRAAESIVHPPRIYPYPAAAVRDFVAACSKSAPNATEARICRCVVDDLQTRLPYADFAAGDRAIRAGRPLPPRASGAIAASTRECRRAAS